MTTLGVESAPLVLTSSRKLDVRVGCPSLAENVVDTDPIGEILSLAGREKPATRTFRESFAEDIGRQILGLVPVADPPDDVSIHAIKVLLVQVGKPGGVALGGLDLRPFVMLLAHGQ